MIESFRIMARMKRQATVSVTVIVSVSVSVTVGHKKGQRQEAGNETLDSPEVKLKIELQM